MFYSYVVNNTQSKNKKEKEIDNKLLTFHLRMCQFAKKLKNKNFIHYV